MIKKLNIDKAIMLSVVSLALPAIAEMALHTAVGVADTIMISRLINKEALAGSGFVNQIVFMLVFIFSSFNTGAVAMVARSFGEKNYKKLNEIAGQNFSVNIIIGLVIMLFALIFSKEIFSIYDMEQVVIDYTHTYFNIIVYGLVFLFVSFAGAALLRGVGDTKTPLYIALLANVLNIIGNYILITGFWIFPEMGIAGAALSTTFSRLVSAALFVYILFFKKYLVHIRSKDLYIKKSVISPLWKFSYPGAIEQALMQISFVIIGVVISSLDTVSEAAFRILINIESLSFMPAVGISLAAATLVGKALGEKDADRALKTGYTAAFLGVLWGIFMSVILVLFPRQMILPFTAEASLIAISLVPLLLLAINQPMLNYMIVMSGALRGAGDTRSVMVITALRIWTLFVPITYVLVHFYGKGIISVWIAEIISFIVFCVIIHLRFAGKKWARIEI
ncbi:MAG: MATE family efflux transporter [Alkaliphilus sp.]|nr:MATE family efflux transporter [bacterium AH-315-L21]PHS33849.1 MAG: MATE family efflux transporter [Alkaliphilus sp.]